MTSPNPFGQEPPPLRRRLPWRDEHPKRPRWHTVKARMPRSRTKLVRVGVLLLVLTGTIYVVARPHHSTRRGSPETTFRVPGPSGYTSSEIVSMVKHKVGEEGVFNPALERITCPEGTYAADALVVCTLHSPKGGGSFDVEVTESGISIKMPEEAG
jgi:hypothetical protein